MKIGDIELTWLGHSTFLVEGKQTIYTDPYVLPANPKKADIILITHDHYDHCDPGKVGQIAKPDTVIVTTADCAKKLPGDVRTVKPGQSIAVEGVQIKAIPSYNIGKPFHPKQKGWVGFLFTVSGISFYIAGDTDFIPEMKGLKPDVALLPIGGTYTMNPDQAVEAAMAIEPKTVVPMHYGTLGDTVADPKEFKKKLNAKSPSVRVEIL